MRIGVLSDTHATSFTEIPDKILITLAEVDMIIHAGDFTTKAVLDGLRQLGEVRAVWGNMDSYELRQALAEKELIIVNGKRIGVTHGWGGPFRMESKVRRIFSEVDVIVYGHTHQPRNEIVEGILFFNPGRARDSFGILTIGKQVKGEIIRLEVSHEISH